jgi:hypothetical protein
MNSNINCLYTIIWVQSSEGLKAKLEEASEFRNIEQASDGLCLIGLIQAAMQEKMAPGVAAYKARKMFLEYVQPSYTSAREYYDHYKSLLEVLHSLGAVPSPTEKLM